MTDAINPQSNVIIIGGGPAGLIAADVLSKANIKVALYERMPSVGRKFLIAGIGGLNITHAEPFELFCNRYTAKDRLTPYLQQFGSKQLCNWCHELGIETFIGSSGRIFPKQMKAAPLLRAWLKRLKQQQVQFYTRHTWQGWGKDNQLIFQTPTETKQTKADIVLLALGGASYPRLGTDGHWATYLQQKNIQCNQWQPANCGFEVNQWSPIFIQKFAGSPIKQITATLDKQQLLGELLISQYGVEGSLIYTLSRNIRQTIEKQGSATLYLDLLPQLSLEKIQQQLAKPKGSQSMTNFLRKQLNLKEAKANLLRELAPLALNDLNKLPEIIKSLPLTLVKPRPITEAISSAGGICFSELNSQLMLNKLPSIFCAGEMLDWEAPTGGYLLTGCFATGYAAGLGIIDYLSTK